MEKSALVTGLTGQDGSYLAELLLEKGYTVYGIARRCSTPGTERISHLLKDVHEKGVRVFRYYGDLTDTDSLIGTLSKIKSEGRRLPDEVYNLGAQSHVGISFDNPVYTADVVGLGVLRVLEVIRSLCPEARFYQASSSEMFGEVREIPQTEQTPFNPLSPYAISKVFAFNATRIYREAYGLHASNGILFNHESERRGINFVTRKITRGLARIKHGLEDGLFLGNLDAERDWGHSRDYVRAMWLMTQQEKADDYVIGTGENHRVREFLEGVANYMGMKIFSNGKKGADEKYLDKNGKTVVGIDPRFIRPLDVNTLLADPTKARARLGWKPEIKFNELIRLMSEHDLEIAEKEAYLLRRTK